MVKSDDFAPGPHPRRPRVEQREDVRMLKSGGGLDFLQKPIGTECAALPQLTLEHVAVTQGINQPSRRCGHGPVGWRRQV